MALSYDKRGSDLVGLKFPEAGLDWTRATGRLESVDEEVIEGVIDGQLIAQNKTSGCNLSARILVTDVGLRATSGFGDVNQRRLTTGREVGVCLLNYANVRHVDVDADSSLGSRGKNRIVSIRATEGSMDIQVKWYQLGTAAKVNRPGNVDPLVEQLRSLVEHASDADPASTAATPSPSAAGPELSRWATGELHRIASQGGLLGRGSKPTATIHDRDGRRRFTQLFDQVSVRKARATLRGTEASDVVGVVFQGSHNGSDVLWIEARELPSIGTAAR